MPKKPVRDVTRIELGDISQTIAVTGNVENPLLLILHGGGLPLPGVASKKDFRLLSERFLVAFWDQRGCGLSNHKSLDDKNMRIEDFLGDVLALTDCLKTHYNKEKIFLAGHSWGSMLGLHAVIHHPENYHAYAGIAQQIRPQLSDTAVFNELRSRAAKQRDRSALHKLDALGAPPYQNVEAWLHLREHAARNQGLVSGQGELGLIGMLKLMFGSFLFSQDHEWFEVLRFQKNMNNVLSKIYDDLIAYDMTEVSTVDIPIVLLHGRYDLNSHPEVARTWYERLSAPSKAWIDFDRSAHMPMWEQPKKFQQEIVRLLD